MRALLCAASALGGAALGAFGGLWLVSNGVAEDHVLLPVLLFPACLGAIGGLLFAVDHLNGPAGSGKEPRP